MTALAMMCASVLAAGCDRQYQPLPWHLADVNLQFPRDRPFEELRVRFRPIMPAGFSDRIVFMPVSGLINGEHFYAGLILDQFEYYDETGTFRVAAGAGFMASLWGSADPQRIRPAAGTRRFWGDHEGKHVSLRRPASLVEDRYTVRLRSCRFPMTNGTEVNGLAVAFKADGEADWIELGTFRLDRPPVLGRFFGSFLEYFGKDHRPDDRRLVLPVVRFEVDKLTLDGEAPELEWVYVDYPRGVPQVARVTVAPNAEHSGAHTFHAGREVFDRRGAELRRRANALTQWDWYHREMLAPR